MRFYKTLTIALFLLLLPIVALSQDNIKEAFGSGDSKDPLLIKSDSLSLDAEKRTFTYKGGVQITRGDVKILAEKVIGKYNDKNEIETVLCTNNIKITKGDQMKANANRAIYKVKHGATDTSASKNPFKS